MNRCAFVLGISLALWLAACEAPAASVPAGETGAPSAAQSVPAAPQRVEFSSADGTVLVGTYHPPAEPPAAAVLLLHQMRATKADWAPLIEALQASADYAIFAFDFPGHGESGGQMSDEAALAAARAALEVVSTLDGADADEIVLIGASIGADAAVDVCEGGCVAAVAVSPGGWLGVPFNDALARLDGVAVFCLAAAGDAIARDTCATASDASPGMPGLTSFRVQTYEGDAHGNALVADAAAAPAPPPLDAIPQWIEGRLAELP